MKIFDKIKVTEIIQVQASLPDLTARLAHNLKMLNLLTQTTLKLKSNLLDPQ